jgi:hypothetical protein
MAGTISRPRGVVSVFAVLMMVGLLLCVGLAMNVGHLFSVRGELHNASDAGALGGAQDLNGTSGQLSVASAAGETYAEKHYTDLSGSDRTQVQATPGSDVRLGFWDPFGSGYAFTAIDPSTLDAATSKAYAGCIRLRDDQGQPACINAVSVRAIRDATHSGGVGTFFASLFSLQRANVGTESVASSGGPCEWPCLQLPVALSNCAFMSDVSCQGNRNFTIKFKSDPTDSAGWTTLDDNARGDNYIKTLLNTLNGAPQGCAEQNVLASQDIWISNGNLANLCTILQQVVSKQNTFAVPVVDAGPCANPKFNQVLPIVGFAKIQITNVVCNNPIHADAILLCETFQPTGKIGCGFFGVSPARPQLVF